MSKHASKEIPDRQKLPKKLHKLIYLKFGKSCLVENKRQYVLSKIDENCQNSKKKW